MHTFMRLFSHVCMDMYVYTYIHTYMHAYLDAKSVLTVHVTLSNITDAYLKIATSQKASMDEKQRMLMIQQEVVV